MAYAEETSIAFERSISEIASLVKRHGAEQVGQMEMPDSFVIQFRLDDRVIRFTLPFPSLADMPTHNGRNQRLTDSQRRDRLAQRKRSLGRALMLVIKAKLESVESGIETLEQAFLANVVMADGATVYDRVREPISIEYQTGKPSVAMLSYRGD